MTPSRTPRATSGYASASPRTRPVRASVVRISPSSTSTEKPDAKAGTTRRATAVSVCA